jgi:hypothetical protein
VTTPLRTGLAALALAVAVVPATAGTADAAIKKHKRTATKTVVKKRTAKKPTKTVKSTPAPAAAVVPAAPAPIETPAPTFTSVISIGGFVFYNISYAEAVEQYQALIASGATPPPPVTSISVTIGVGN